MSNNKYCYKFKEYTYYDGLLNSCIDATYIIHLVNNGRYDDIQKQLNKYHPSNKVYLVENKGYKNCKKKLPKNTPSYDLIDSYIHIFKHANKNNYNNILILEDDFIFNPKIKNKHVCKDISNFINKKNESFVYYLGCLPYLKYNLLSNHEKVFMATGTHAVIYSKKFRQNILNSNTNKIYDWDLNIAHNQLSLNKYCYRIPLCYQCFPETENQKNWPFYYGLKPLILLILKILKLDTQYEPGFTFFYNMSSILFYLLIVVILFIIYKFLFK